MRYVASFVMILKRGTDPYHARTMHCHKLMMYMCVERKKSEKEEEEREKGTYIHLSLLDVCMSVCEFNGRRRAIRIHARIYHERVSE